MSRTERHPEAINAANKDWWSRRPNSGQRFVTRKGRRWWKRNTHKRERKVVHDE
jgi:hypothetical protein